MTKQMSLGSVQEYRDIKITSKRQLTIPKSFFDSLNIEETVQAYLLEDGIFLKPVHSQESVYEKDVQAIVRKVLAEGYSGENLVKEMAHRIAQYDRLLENRIQEFTEDMKAPAGSDSDEGDLDYNGLDVFFDKEDGATAEGN